MYSVRSTSEKDKDLILAVLDRSSHSEAMMNIKNELLLEKAKRARKLMGKAMDKEIDRTRPNLKLLWSQVPK